MNHDEELNPYLNTTIGFIKEHTFAIHSFIDGKRRFLEEKRFNSSIRPIYFYNLRKQVLFLDFTISYKCGNDSNRTSFKEFIDTYDDNLLGRFDFYYPRLINHINDPPIQKVKDNSNFFFMILTFLKTLD